MFNVCVAGDQWIIDQTPRVRLGAYGVISLNR